MIIWTIAYLSLLSQIFALTKVFLLEHLFFFILRCLFNYFYLMLIYLFIHSFAPLLLCFLICSFYLFILSLACIFICVFIAFSLIHIHIAFSHLLPLHSFSFHFWIVINIVKKVDLTYVLLDPDNSYPWRMSRDLGIILTIWFKMFF